MILSSYGAVHNFTKNSKVFEPKGNYWALGFILVLNLAKMQKIDICNI